MLFNGLKASAKDTAKKGDEGGYFWGVGIRLEKKKMVQGALNFQILLNGC